MIYEYECRNSQCTLNGKPYEFTGNQSLDKYKEPVECPKCGKKDQVKKVVRTPFVKSQSWQV